MRFIRKVFPKNQQTQHTTVEHSMTTLKRLALANLFGGLVSLSSQAQFTFSSGSDGSYGPMNITTNTTLDLPPDGRFHCTTIDVAAGVTLSFSRNALNTPVYLLATSNVTINGTIDVSAASGAPLAGGAGGPGGFEGGRPGYADLPLGDGHGPGAGRVGPNGGAAAYGTTPTPYYGSGEQHGMIYGSPLLVPLVGGSGGSAWDNGGGGGGGGAVLIASNTRIEVGGGGSVVARGGTPAVVYSDTMGSGGAIRLVAPIVTGTGYLDAAGGMSRSDARKFGGSGRIRIDCMDRRALALGFNGPISIGANMVVIPGNSPRLDVIQVAGNNIPPGTNSPVFFMLPQDSPTNQTVTVQARNFKAVVPIRVVLTPENGPRASYDAQIDNTTVDPASVTVDVAVPVNVRVEVNAWTR
jgi:hypothetical protein